jgi:hypothetical protein
MEPIELKQSNVLVEDQLLDADLTGQKLVMFLDKSIVMKLAELGKVVAAYCGPLPNLKSEMSKIKTLSFIIFLFISACQNSSEIQHSIEEEIINIDLDQSSGGKLSEYFSGITYTLIENQEANPLVESYQTIVTSNSIFIQDYFNSYVHKFDRKGILQNLFKSTGQGPQEYQQLDHFQVVGDTLFILDRSLRKILGYNSEQQVVYEEFIPVNASIFHKQGDRILFFMNNISDKSESNFLLFQEGALIQESIKIRDGFEKFQHGAKNGLNPDFKSGYLFPIPFSQQVVFFKNDLSFHKKVTFDFGSYSVKDLDFLRLHNSSRSEFYDFIKENNLVENISTFTKLGESYFMSISQTNKNLHFIFLDKEMNVKSQVNNFENDIDQMKIRNIPWTVFENNLIFKINSVDFYNDYIAKFSEQKVSIEEGSIHEFFQLNQEKLKDDQTVLVSLKLREDF